LGREHAVVLRLVLDTDVLVAALRSRTGASRQLLQAVLRDRCILLLSQPLCVEYEAVLTRPAHLAASRLTGAQVQRLLDGIVSLAEEVEPYFLWRPVLRDPDDDMVLEAAVNGRADLLVTFNRRDYGHVAGRFGVVVCSPAEAMDRLEGE
jgi:putative PIN family toxin of toxin-antitoxin system